jgi:hypothetical protein
MRKRLVVSAAVANSTLVLIVNMLTKTKPKGVTGFVFMEMSPRSLITPKSIGTDATFVAFLADQNS